MSEECGGGMCHWRPLITQLNNSRLPFIESLLCARHWAKHFTYLMSFNLLTNGGVGCLWLHFTDMKVRRSEIEQQALEPTNRKSLSHTLSWIPLKFVFWNHSLYLSLNIRARKGKGKERERFYSLRCLELLSRTTSGQYFRGLRKQSKELKELGSPAWRNSLLSKVGPLAWEAKGQQADKPGVTTITHITPALKLLEADKN